MSTKCFSCTSLLDKEVILILLSLININGVLIGKIANSLDYVQIQTIAVDERIRDWFTSLLLFGGSLLKNVWSVQNKVPIEKLKKPFPMLGLVIVAEKGVDWHLENQLTVEPNANHGREIVSIKKTELKGALIFSEFPQIPSDFFAVGVSPKYFAYSGEKI